MEAKVLLSSLEQSSACLRPERVPGGAVLNRREGEIAVERHERRLETFWGAGVGEQVALTAARSRRVDRIRQR
jgi:hypothetical protein